MVFFMKTASTPALYFIEMINCHNAIWFFSLLLFLNYFLQLFIRKKIFIKITEHFNNKFIIINILIFFPIIRFYIFFC